MQLSAAPFIRAARRGARADFGISSLSGFLLTPQGGNIACDLFNEVNYYQTS
jgi:hypothetical protein